LPIVNLRFLAVSLVVVCVVLLAGGGWLWWKGRPDSLYQSAEDYYREGQRLYGGDDLHKKSDQDLEKCRSAYERARTLIDQFRERAPQDPRLAKANVLRYKVLMPLARVVEVQEQRKRTPPAERQAASIKEEAFRSGPDALKADDKDVEALAIVVEDHFRRNDFDGAYPYARALIDNLPADLSSVDLENFNDYVIGAYYVVALKDLKNGRPEQALRDMELSLALERPRADGRPTAPRWRAVAVEVEALQKIAAQSAKHPPEARAAEERLKALLAQSVERARSELRETVPAADDRPETPALAALSLTNTTGLVEVLLASVGSADSRAAVTDRADVLLTVCEELAGTPKAAGHVYHEAVRGARGLTQINDRLPAANRLEPGERIQAHERALAINDAVLKNGGPGDPSAYLAMSLTAQQAQNDRPRALTLARRGLEIAAERHLKPDDPRLLELRKQVAWLLLLDHKVSEAEEQLAPLAKYKPLGPDIAYMRGLGAILDGRLEEGVRQLSEARKSPRYRDAVPLLLGLAHAYTGLGQPENALAPLQELYRIRKTQEVKDRDDLAWANVWQPTLDHASLSLLDCYLTLALRAARPTESPAYREAQKHSKELQGTSLGDDAALALLNFDLARLRSLVAKDPDGLEVDPLRKEIDKRIDQLQKTSPNDPRVLWAEVSFILTRHETNPAVVGAAVGATLGAPTDVAARLGETGRYHAGSAWQWQKAEQRIMQAAARQKGSLPVQLTWVRWLVDSGRTEDALAKLSELEDKAAGDKERRQVQTARARLLLAAGQKDKAAGIIEALRKDGEDVNAQLLYALEVLLNGKPDEARQVLERVLSRPEQSGLYHFYQGLKRQADGDFAQAIASYERSLQFTQLKAWSQAALVACVAGIADGPPGKPEKADPEAAFQEARRLKATHPRDPAVLLAYAVAARAMDAIYGSDGMEGALSDLVKILAEDKATAAQGPFVAAQQWVAAGRPDVARRVLRDNRRHPPSLVLATRLAVADEDWAEAAGDLEALAALAPDAIDLPLWRAALHEARGEVREAKELYARFAQDHPDMSAGYLAMARVHERAKEYKEARTWVERWRGKMPDDRDGLRANVRVLAEDGQVAEATKAAEVYVKGQLRKAQEAREAWEAKNPIAEKDEDRARRRAALLDGLEASLVVDVASAFQQAGAYAEAEKWLSERALPLLDKLPEGTRKGNRVGLKLVRGTLYMEQGRRLKEGSPERAQFMDRAIQEYDEVYREVPGHLVAGNNLAWLLVTEKNQPARAVAVVEEVRKGKYSRQPVSPERLPLEFLDTIGVVYRAANMNQEALTLFKEAVRQRYAQEPRLLMHLALAQAALGLKSDALATFRAVVSLADRQANATADPERKARLVKLSADAQLEQKRLGTRP
jgi:hypothetical protein